MNNHFTSGPHALQSGSYDDASRAADAMLQESLDQFIAKLKLQSTIALRVGETYPDAELQMLRRQFMTASSGAPLTR